MITLIEPGAREQVEHAIRDNGGQPLPFRVAAEGLRFHSAVRETSATA